MGPLLSYPGIGNTSFIQSTLTGLTAATTCAAALSLSASATLAFTLTGTLTTASATLTLRLAALILAAAGTLALAGSLALSIGAVSVSSGHISHLLSVVMGTPRRTTAAIAGQPETNPGF